MLIKNIESKVKLALVVSVLTLVTSVAIVVLVTVFAYKTIDEHNNSVYVLDGGIPLLVKQTSMDINREAEYKSHIKTFHQLFYTLPPDEKYIEQNVRNSLYLIDESGVNEYNALEEKGYYNQILSSSAVVTLITDSVSLDLNTKKFKFYGTQRIERKSSVLTRTMVTSGTLRDMPRSENNPHGCMILNWRVESNDDIDLTRKRNL